MRTMLIYHAALVEHDGLSDDSLRCFHLHHRAEQHHDAGWVG